MKINLQKTIFYAPKNITFSALARVLRYSRETVHSWARDGVPKIRVDELTKYFKNHSVKIHYHE